MTHTKVSKECYWNTPSTSGDEFRSEDWKNEEEVLVPVVSMSEHKDYVLLRLDLFNISSLRT